MCVNLHIHVFCVLSEVSGYLQGWDLMHKGDTCCRNAVDECFLVFQCYIQGEALTQNHVSI